MSIAFPIVSWANGSNVYEVNIRQYTKEGNFKAFLAHLHRLKDMGVDILWLMPITPISKEKIQGTHGSYYACSCYTDLHNDYGDVEQFTNLIKQAHNLGLKVIIDWVANHTGFDHHWTKEHPDWYKKDEHGNFIELYGWLDVIDLDYNNAEMRKEMIKCMQHWIKEYDIDGFRCDMAHLVPLDFWLEARIQCDVLKPLFWLAECEDVNYHEVFDATYAWEWLHASERIYQNESTILQATEVLHRYTQYPAGSRKLLFTSNHDENSWNGTEYERYGALAKALAVFSCTWPGIPLIYSGQEKPVYKRILFFDKDEIDWQGNIELHIFYKKLLELRKKNKALQENASVLLLQSSMPEAVLAYLCRRQYDKVLVVLNLSKQAVTCVLKHPAITGDYTDLYNDINVQLSKQQEFSLQAGQYLVYYKTED